MLRKFITSFLFLALLLIAVLVTPVMASEETTINEAPAISSSVFWADIRGKLNKYLATRINTKVYKYEVEGPVTNMKGFLGNRPNSEIVFSGPNFNNVNHRKMIYAQAKGHNLKIPIAIKVWKYKDLWIFSKNISARADLNETNVRKERRLILPKDEKLYYNEARAPYRKVALRNFKAGTALKINMLGKAKVIQAGDVVELVRDSGYINISMRCRSFGSGDIGDTINLSCPELKQKSAKGIILAPGKARFAS